MLSAGWQDAPGEPTRVRGMLQFYGAFRTGRWAGRLIQLQNLPRGTVKKIDDAIQMALSGASVPGMEMFFGPALGIVSSALRGCLVSAPGHQLVVVDFSQIEARVVAWLAGQQDILDVFAAGEDVYVYTARQNGSNDRQLGKVLVLACGFGMSAKKFRDTARTYGLILSEEQAERAVKGWRRANAKIVQFWYDCDNAARLVIKNADANGNHAPITVGPVQFAMWRGHMLIRLPSGRHLVYRDAKLVPGRFSDKSISYMGVDQYTRQWSRQHTYGGKLVENITQAVARDIMRDATLGADRAGIAVEMLVHDEMVCEVETSKAQWALDTLLAIMRTRPAWAPGLPVDGAGWFGERYRK
jgi:DNA polymerase